MAVLVDQHIGFTTPNQYNSIIRQAAELMRQADNKLVEAHDMVLQMVNGDDSLTDSFTAMKTKLAGESDAKMKLLYEKIQDVYGKSNDNNQKSNVRISRDVFATLLRG